jgi:hypothetical protein
MPQHGGILNTLDIFGSNTLLIKTVFCNYYKFCNMLPFTLLINCSWSAQVFLLLLYLSPFSHIHVRINLSRTEQNYNFIHYEVGDTQYPYIQYLVSDSEVVSFITAFVLIYTYLYFLVSGSHISFIFLLTLFQCYCLIEFPHEIHIRHCFIMLG